jgi:hypothetical protein
MNVYSLFLSFQNMSNLECIQTCVEFLHTFPSTSRGLYREAVSFLVLVLALIHHAVRA